MERVKDLDHKRKKVVSPYKDCELNWGKKKQLLQGREFYSLEVKTQ